MGEDGYKTELSPVNGPLRRVIRVGAKLLVGGIVATVAVSGCVGPAGVPPMKALNLVRIASGNAQTSE